MTRLRPATVAVAFWTGFAVPAAAQRPARTDCEGETTAEVRRCLTETLRNAEAELEASLRRARLEAKDSAPLDSAQAAWRSFVDRDCRAAADVYRGGSLAPVVALGCRLDHTRLRLRAIRNDYLAGDTAAPGRREP